MDSFQYLHTDIYSNNLIWSLMYYDQMIPNTEYHLTVLSEANRYFYNAAHALQTASTDIIDEIENFYMEKDLIPSFYLDPKTPSGVLEELIKRDYQEAPEESEHWYRFDLRKQIPNSERFLKLNPSQIEIKEVVPEDIQFLDFVGINRLMNGLTPELASKYLHNCRTRKIPEIKNHYFLAFVDGKPASTGSVGIVGETAFFAEGATLPEYQRRGIYSYILADRLQFSLQQRCRNACVICEQGAYSSRGAVKVGFDPYFSRKLFYKTK